MKMRRGEGGLGRCYGRTHAVWQKRILISLLGLLFLTSSVLAQTPIGTWRAHPNYRSAQAVVVVQNKIYYASENGLFFFDIIDNESTILGTVDGFTETGVSRLLYLPEQKRLVIGYRSGTIDLLDVTDTGEPQKITPLTLIRDATQIQGSKRINHILRSSSAGNDIYVSCDFGIVVLDIAKSELRDTYRNIGPNGSSVEVYSTALANDSLYALTSHGLLAARFISTVNLAFFGNWYPVMLPNQAIPQSVVGVNNHLYVAVSGQGVMERQGGAWRIIHPFPGISGLLPGSVEWIMKTQNQLRWQSGVQLVDSLLVNPKEVVEAVGNWWVADSLNGLLRIEGTTVTVVSPGGPASDLFERLLAVPNTVLALPGGVTDNLLPLRRRRGFDLFRDGRWRNMLDKSLPTDVLSAVLHPAEQRLYWASFGGGIWSLGSDGSPEVVDRTILNSSSVAVDRNGELWFVAPTLSNKTALYVRRKNGQIQSFSTPRTDLLQLLIDDNGFLWIRLSPVYGGGILVFNPATNQIRLLVAAPAEGNLPTNAVRSMIKDRDGLIWVGTDRGVAVFDDPAGIFTGAVNAYIPILNQRRLLNTESVTAMTVDGSNRKWLGTRTGLYLVNADGTKLISQFTTENSLLPSNAITDVAVEPISGEVFIATDVGLVSYRGTATEPATVLSGIMIFPNPVRPDFGGMVGISGLVENTVVKIMDAAGQLVYETRSQGGMATWNLRDYRGSVARTGIYFVFALTPDGREGLVGKLAVVQP